MIFAALAVCGGGASAQRHSSSDVGGGRIKQITLPVPRTIAGGRTRDVAKRAMQLVTVNEDGSWYYLPDAITRQGELAKLVAAFTPKDLRLERVRLFKRYSESDDAMAHDYLTWLGTLYSVEILCPTGEYRFTAGVDVNAETAIAAVPLDSDWREWRTTNNTPWEPVKRRVCEQK